ncbi:integrator complex subunit 10 [Patella vulgata]|uniref:integrator complex subunit 10 n=1 Tax=Patella vulgata TaxID=6465 RepID=UPI0024A90E92|nr:integrator complex subunit 10 [Patella vulgata]
MASSCENPMLSDAEWLVMRARGYAKSDPWAAKAWLITARTLFPGSFLIQFESYQLEKGARNIKDAAVHLEDMLKNFQHEGNLWNEVQSILEALQTDTGSQDSKNNFLTEIFAATPTHVQCQMLLSVADKMNDVLERCRLLLLAMKKFPNLVTEHGLKLVEMLCVEESRTRMTSPVNCYRKLFVCDILPLVLQKNRHLNIPPGQMFLWLQRAVEFYISFITQPAIMDTPLSPDMMSPTKALAKRVVSIPGLLERECQITDPWGNLFRLLQLVGSHVGWEMEADVFTKTRDYQDKCDIFTGIIRINGIYLQGLSG